jgi:putative transposase
VNRYGCVDDQKAAGFPVTIACEAAGVSTSGYYDWCQRELTGPTERQVAEAELVVMMRQIFDDADGNYGVPRMYDALRKGGLKINRKRVARLMRRHGMAGRFRPRKCRTTFPGPDGYTIPDLVGRRFAPGAPDVAWRGARTSPTSRRPRVGCTWRRSSTSDRAGCWATRWLITCAPNSSLTR